MLVHIDGSAHQWFCDHRWYDLVVVMDDATSEIYYAQLVTEESTRTVMTALREVLETKGLFCALYSARASHFFLTPKAGEAVDHDRSTQVGRAMKDLGVKLIPAYSPPARGRSERGFGTWQGRFTAGTARPWDKDARRGRFSVATSAHGTAFVPLRRKDLDLVFSVQHERVVARDNTVSFANKVWQLERSKLRATLAGCRVTIHQHVFKFAGWKDLK